MAIVAIGISGCGGGKATSSDSEKAPDSVTITVGSGIAYAPLILMQNQKLLEKRFPTTKFAWKEGVSGGAATRDGMLSGQIQLGVAGVAPFLVGLDKGVKWKVIGSMGQLDAWLVVKDPGIKTLGDLAKSGKKISVPSPDSGQAIALKSVAQKELGRVDVFDNQLVSLGHPDAVQSLLAGATGAAYTGAPFQYNLVNNNGAHRVSSLWDTFGKMTYSSLVMTQDYYDAHPKFGKGVFDALQEALAELRDRPTEAAAALSAAEGGRTPPAQYESWMKAPNVEWSSEPQGYLANATFMKSIGIIKNVPAKVQDFAFSTVTSGN